MQQLLVVLFLFWQALFSAADDAPRSEPKFIYNPKYVLDMYHAGLSRLRAKARTDDCKMRIEFEYMKEMRVVSEERPYPFEDVFFHSQCERTYTESRPPLPVGMRTIPQRPPVVPPPLPNNATRKHPDDISILYVMLVHDHASLAERIVRALDEAQHSFVIHVDTKAPHVYEQLKVFASQTATGIQPALKGKLHVLENDRQSVNWGGFSVVNATLVAMRYAWDLGVSFDYMIDISGSTYPLVSNQEIRTVLAKQPGYTYMDVHERPSRPNADMWHQYVECDEGLHRISRLATLRGMNMHVGSQWFALPWHVVHWFLHNRLPLDYINYAKRVVVADEHYFATLFKNSPYCDELVNKNLLYVVFDKWENEKQSERSMRNSKKCLHPDPDHCGRSPTTLTPEYRRLLQTSQHLFARKFDPMNPASLEMLAIIDRWRAAPEHRMEGAAQTFMIRQFTETVVGDAAADPAMGHSALKPSAVFKSANIKEDLCMSMDGSNRGKPVKLAPCNANDANQWFTMSRCSNTFSDTRPINLAQSECGMFVTASADSTAGGDTMRTNDVASEVPWKTKRHAHPTEDSVTCQISHAELSSSPSPSKGGVCLDISGENPHSGSTIIGWECTGNWNQLFHFGEDCTLSAVHPKVIAEARGLPQNITRCLESLTTGGIHTAVCPEEPVVNEVDQSATLHSSPRQRWQMLPRDGKLWENYSKVSSVQSDEIDEEL